MRKILFVSLLTLILIPVNAVKYCASSSWGYAGSSVTGGGDAAPVTVSSESELKDALKKSNRVIIITRNCTISNQISCDKSNLTIMALPGVRLVSTQQSKDVSGILGLKGSNIILRNLIFEGPGAFDCDGKDNLTLDGATDVWVDHCDFQDGCDGNFDIKGNSDNVSVTWCRFRYLKEPKAGGSGGSDDHRFSNLIGSSSTQKPEDGTYNITFAFCWWDEGCKQRMTRCRNCELHFLNCYWNSSVADYYVGPENAKCYFEGCTFAGKANSPSKIWSDSYGGDDERCTFVNCSGNLPDNTSPGVAAPTYSYDALDAATAKNYVTNSSCGTGATLTVSSSAEVSSSCDGDEPEPQPQPGDTTLTWNFSTSDFTALTGDITTNTTVNGLTIAASSDKKVTIAESDKTIETLTFTHVLKFNGSGNASYRNLSFAVTGECSIDVYLISANPSEDRTLNIYSGSYSGTPIATMPATVTAAKQTFNYTGNAATIYLGSANSGINIYGINVSYSEAPSAIEPVQNKNVARKVLRNGQVLIVRDDKTYNVLGTRVR